PHLFRQVLGTPEAGSPGKLQIGFGQIMFEGVVQASYDRREMELVREFFLEFLRLVDNKDQPDTALKAAGWNSGYVISARLTIFADLIKQSLIGDFLGKGAPASKTDRLSGTEGLTQNAMSSVASMLGGQRPLSVADPDGRLLSALAGHIHDPRVELKGRL